MKKTIGSVFLVFMFITFSLSCAVRSAPIPPTPTPTLPPTFTLTSIPTLASTPTLTPNPTLIPFPTLNPSSIWTRPADGMTMVLVEQGAFTMGQNSDQAFAECQKFESDCLQSWFADLQPPHSVSLDAYWIDQTDITNAMYGLCVKAGACEAVPPTDSDGSPTYFSNSQYSDYPVTYVTWMDANNYCSWAGARLPTEAEWEKAARGTDERIYPWGNSSPTCTLANFSPAGSMDPCVGAANSAGEISPVGSYPAGASPYGALDMAGNVHQWVQDWYSATYYLENPPKSNPQGPRSGSERVIRGGSHINGEISLSTTSRSSFDPARPQRNVGFRCSRSNP